MIKNFYEESLIRSGYFKALCDVKNYFERHSIVLKREKMYNQKGINALLQAMLDNLEVMQEQGEFVEFTKTNDGRIVLSNE